MADYVGARYTIKVYENSLVPSSAEWESGFAYEPLTMVTYNNATYLSRKQVPASASNPPAEPSFWVETGAYNGQIMALDNRISDIETLDGTLPLSTTAQTLIGAINELNTFTDITSQIIAYTGNIDLISKRGYVYGRHVHVELVVKYLASEPYSQMFATLPSICAPDNLTNTPKLVGIGQLNRNGAIDGTFAAAHIAYDINNLIGVTFHGTATYVTDDIVTVILDYIK